MRARYASVRPYRAISGGVPYPWSAVVSWGVWVTIRCRWMSR